MILDALRRADAERERGAVPGLHARPAPLPSVPAPASARWSWGLAAAVGAALLGATAFWLAAGDSMRDAARPRGLPAAATAPVPLAPSPRNVVASGPTSSPTGPAAPAASTLAAGASPAASSGAPPARAAAPAAPIASPAAPTVVTATSAASPATSAAAPATAAVSPAIAPASAAASAAALTAPGPAVPTPAPARPQPIAEPAPWPSSAAAKRPAAAAAASSAAEPPVVPRDRLPEEVRAQLPPLAIGGSIYSASPADRSLIIDGRIYRENDRLGADLTLERIGVQSAVLRYKGYRFEIGF
jgi:general secretion pathway protein B